MSVCLCDARTVYRNDRPWQHVADCPGREVVEVSYMDDLNVDSDQSARDRMEAIRLHVTALGELIDAEDAVTGQGASVYASVTMAIRDVYAELRARRRHPTRLSR